MRAGPQRNRYQKAAYRPGERRVGRAQVAELLELARGDDAEARLVAAKFLCPCHVRGRNEEIWQAVLALMGDEDRRVRMSAWHTLEDGGVPKEAGVLEALEARLGQESDPGVLGMARFAIGPLLAERDRRDLGLMRRPPPVLRGKCDFCGERGVAVDRDFDTMIPTADLPRPALICQSCAAPSSSAGKGRSPQLKQRCGRRPLAKAVRSVPSIRHRRASVPATHASDARIGRARARPRRGASLVRSSVGRALARPRPTQGAWVAGTDARP